MDYLKTKCVTRIENFLLNLNNVLFMTNDDLSSSDLDEDVVDYVSTLLVKYVVSVCEDEDLSDNKQVGDIEESVEAQKLVEYECNDVYKSRVSLALKNLILSKMSLYTFGKFSGYNLFVDFEETHEGFLNDFNTTNDLLITSDILSSSENVLYSQTEVSKFLKVRACRLALEFVSDVPLKSKCTETDENQTQQLYLGINYKMHGMMVLRRFSSLCTSVCPLKTNLHSEFLKSHLSHTGPSKRINLGYLNCSRPWIVYWTLHSLALLGEELTPYKERSINTLMSCWDSKCGGFGGGEGQRGHVATTYSALCVLKMFDSLKVVDAEQLYSFLMDMKMENGSFSATYGGESDSRSTYCAVASAHLMGLLTEKLTEKTPEFLQSCQTYEGGLSAEPFLEAHAGYTYCGLSAMKILGELGKLDLNKLYHWALRRLTSQLGFQGRPHKLVDSCYSFWLGGCLEILNNYSNEFFPMFDKNNNYYSDSWSRTFFDSNNDTNSSKCNDDAYPNSNYDYTLTNDSKDARDCNNKPVLKDASLTNRNDKEDKEKEKEENKEYDTQGINKQSGTRLYEHLLRCYLLVVSQTGKGFRDKPNKPSDLYHTCYSLSYLNIINPITDRKHDVVLNLVKL